MGIASYSTGTCNDCIDTTQQPVFGNVAGASETRCITDCVATSTSAIPAPLIPDGTPWQVDYFLQVLGSGDAPSPIDHHLNPVFQRLAWLKDMTLFVTQALTTDIDPDTNVTTRQGAATFVGVAPEIGDAFVAVLEFGIAYLFRVTEAAPLAVTGAKIYRISYSAYGVINGAEATLDDFAHKVADYDRYNFNLSLYLKGETPFTTAAAAEVEATASTTLDSLIQDWESFYDADSACYVATVGDKRVYDPYVNEIMHKLIPYNRPQCNGIGRMWQRMVSQYRKTCAVLPYNAKTGFSTVKVYDRSSYRPMLNLDSIKHTAIEMFVHDGTRMADSDGYEMSTLEGTTVHADGYIVSELYNSGDPLRPAIDQLIEAIHAGIVTPTLVALAKVEYEALSAADKYWVIPIMINGLRASRS